MQAVKSAVGLGKKDAEEGEEPVSGEQGAGTTAEPLDAGNKQAQAEETKDTAAVAQDSKPDSNADTTEGAQEEDDSSKDKKKGGWLKNPFKSKKDDDGKEDPKQASAGAEQPKQDLEEEKNLPPNVLGANVPKGASTDFAPPGTPGEGANPDSNEAQKTETMAQAQEHNDTVKQASADNVDEGKFGQAGLLDPGRSSSRSGSQQGGGGPSPAVLRGSRASIAEPTKPRVFNPHAQNPGRIPTAGGVAVGSKQYERRTSRVSQDLAPPEKGGSLLDKEGSADAGTQSNTVTNTGPTSPPIQEEDEAGGPKDTSAPPQFNTSPFGEGSSGEGAASANGTTGATGTTAEASGDKSKVEDMKEKAKENLPVGGSSGSKGATESKERRGSTFGRLKDKLSGKK